MMSTPVVQLKRQLQYFYTPLRYPGGKSSLFSFFGSIIEKNGLKNAQYVEPYAGGAGAALSLLILGKVDSIDINDLDRAVYAFWKAITEDTDRFIRRIRRFTIARKGGQDAATGIAPPHAVVLDIADKEIVGPVQHDAVGLLELRLV